jgi:acyl-CoA carboxylase epsilon subunit
MTDGERVVSAGQPAAAELGGLTVAAGQPTAAELAAVTAALTAVLATRAAADRAAADRAAAARRPPAGGWAGRAHLLRAPLVPGPDAWRRSARPR